MSATALSFWWVFSSVNHGDYIKAVLDRNLLIVHNRACIMPWPAFLGNTWINTFSDRKKGLVTIQGTKSHAVSNAAPHKQFR